MQRLLETFILYCILVAFALYGVFYLAPRVSEALRNHLIEAAEGKP